MTYPGGEVPAAALTWFLGQFVTPFVDKLKDEALQRRWRKFDWPKAEQAYRDTLIRHYDRVRVLGKPDEVPLHDVFTDVYILDSITARLRFDIAELRKRGETNPIRFHLPLSAFICGQELLP